MGAMPLADDIFVSAEIRGENFSHLDADSDEKLRRAWLSWFPEESWFPNPDWWVPGDLGVIATRPAAGAQGERARLLKRYPRTQPIYDRWLACTATQRCRTPHCTECTGPRGIVQIELRRTISRFFAGICRRKIRIVTHHLEPVLIDTNDIDGSAYALTHRVKAWRGALMKRIQRHAPNARVFCTIEAEPKRVRDVSDGLYPDRRWRSRFGHDDIVALLHVHAVVFDPDDQMTPVWVNRNRQPGFSQTRMQDFKPSPIGLALDNDGLGYVAGYGLKRRVGYDFARQTEAVFLILSLMDDSLGVSGLGFFAGGRRRTGGECIKPTANHGTEKSDSAIPIGRVHSANELRKTFEISIRRVRFLFDSSPEFTFYIIYIIVRLSANRARGPPSQSGWAAWGNSVSILFIDSISSPWLQPFIR